MTLQDTSDTGLAGTAYGSGAENSVQALRPGVSEGKISDLLLSPILCDPPTSTHVFVPWTAGSRPKPSY